MKKPTQKIPNRNTDEKKSRSSSGSDRRSARSSDEGRRSSSGGERKFSRSSGEGRSSSGSDRRSARSSGEGRRPSSGGERKFSRSSGEGRSSSGSDRRSARSSGEGRRPSSGGERRFSRSSGEGRSSSGSERRSARSSGEGRRPSSGGERRFSRSSGEGRSSSGSERRSARSSGEGRRSFREDGSQERSSEKRPYRIHKQRENVSREILYKPVKKKITDVPVLDKELAVNNLLKAIGGKRTDTGKKQFPMRINRFLALCGLGSRRQVEDYVLKGRIALNGNKVLNLDAKVQSDDSVQVDGKNVSFDGNFIYIAMNKPAGYTVSRRRFKNDRTVYELLPENENNVNYAGRLDRESRGLLILSNDGNFISAVTHPSKRITKKYHVTVDHLPQPEEIQRQFLKGIHDDGELLKAVGVRILDREKKIIEVVLGEGKKRQLRRMFRQMNLKILDLYRVSVGFLSLEHLDVPEGKTVSFSPEELMFGGKAKKAKDEEILENFNPWKLR